MNNGEKVMVVPSEILLPILNDKIFITGNIDQIINVIKNNHQFVERSYAEHALEYKQIIPYVVMACDSNFFLTKRLNGQTEKRLHGMYSLGMGGHINPSEEFATDIIMAGMHRELLEEVGIACPEENECLGIINDLSTDVSNYHIGLLYQINTNADISISEKTKMTGYWASIKEIDSKIEELESWSQIIWRNRDLWKK